MDLTQRTETFGTEDLSWLASEADVQFADSITLDGVLLLVPFPTGIIPAGVVLGKVTATGRYGPYFATAVDGTETADGFLLFPKQITRADLGDATARNVSGPLLWRGEIVSAKVPAAVGGSYSGLDAAAKTDLANRFRFV